MLLGIKQHYRVFLILLYKSLGNILKSRMTKSWIIYITSETKRGTCEYALFWTSVVFIPNPCVSLSDSASLPYPCIGVFRFLDFPACLSPVYPEVLQRVRAGETFLDLGCCFGQDIRKLLVDGAPSDNIIGVDTESRFIDLGYDLFGDRETLKARFYTGDVFAEDFLHEFRGKIDIIFAGSFLHLFSFEQQKVIVAQLGKLLRPKKGSLVFGRHMATAEQGGTIRKNALGWDLYHHSPDTIRQLWDTAPDGQWEVSSNLVDYASESWDNGVNWQGGNHVKQQYFAAKRL